MSVGIIIFNKNCIMYKGNRNYLSNTYFIITITEKKYDFFPPFTIKTKQVKLSTYNLARIIIGAFNKS